MKETLKRFEALMERCLQLEKKVQSMKTICATNNTRETMERLEVLEKELFMAVNEGREMDDDLDVFVFAFTDPRHGDIRAVLTKDYATVHSAAEKIDQTVLALMDYRARRVEFIDYFFYRCNEMHMVPTGTMGLTFLDLRQYAEVWTAAKAEAHLQRVASEIKPEELHVVMPLVNMRKFIVARSKSEADRIAALIEGHVDHFAPRPMRTAVTTVIPAPRMGGMFSLTFPDIHAGMMEIFRFENELVDYLTAIMQQVDADVLLDAVEKQEAASGTLMSTEDEFWEGVATFIKDPFPWGVTECQIGPRLAVARYMVTHGKPESPKKQNKGKK